jgi:hypothetical protein
MRIFGLCCKSLPLKSRGSTAALAFSAPRLVLSEFPAEIKPAAKAAGSLSAVIS